MNSKGYYPTVYQRHRRKEEKVHRRKFGRERENFNMSETEEKKERMNEQIRQMRARKFQREDAAESASRNSMLVKAAAAVACVAVLAGLGFQYASMVPSTSAILNRLWFELTGV